MGREAQRFMDAGELVPDEVILGIIGEALQGDDAHDCFVLDGFPRTVAQAEGLGRILEDLGIHLDAILNISVDDDEIVRRLSTRLLCSSCGTALGPGGESDEACPECGGTLVQRRDDGAETVRYRLVVYRNQTEPVLSWYRDSGARVVDVDGLGSVDEIRDRVRAGIGI